jgi:hypothetical protein
MPRRFLSTDPAGRRVRPGFRRFWSQANRRSWWPGFCWDRNLRKIQICLSSARRQSRWIVLSAEMPKRWVIKRTFACSIGVTASPETGNVCTAKHAPSRCSARTRCSVANALQTMQIRSLLRCDALRRLQPNRLNRSFGLYRHPPEAPRVWTLPAAIIRGATGGLDGNRSIPRSVTSTRASR